ncbi:MAG TPA: NADPH-dependent FMN reductase [Acidimicrobiia bacterium]|jgi:NAD(P)H-dependent FMN reductase|nr:NADPH-dependent FMN reductase [Acidimicrobiia bacterium]
MNRVTTSFGPRMAGSTKILLVSGSLRMKSTNTAVLRTARSLAPIDIDATLYHGLVDLPHFNPDDDRDPLHPAVESLRTEIRRADALLFSTPEYAGALPGSFKNVLDWMIGDDQVGSVYEKPVAWINASPRGAVLAHESLRKVLGYAGAVIVEAACVHTPVIAASVGDDGLISDPGIRVHIADALVRLADHVARERVATR